MAKTASKSFLLSDSSKSQYFFAVLMYALYGYPRYFKFKLKYQQHGPFPDYVSISYDYTYVNKHVLLIWNFEQQMFTMNKKKQPPEVFYKKAVLKSFSKCLRLSLFLIKLRVFRSATLLKRDTNKGAFLWILRDF